MERSVSRRARTVSALMLAVLITLTVGVAPASAKRYPGPDGPRSVIGEIERAWLRAGGASGFLGAPLTDEWTAPDGVGRFTHFERGSIYWTPATGAHEVHGAIRDRWASEGWERSFLGYPISDETYERLGERWAKISRFQYGDLFWYPDTQMAVVRGAISEAARRSDWSLGLAFGDEFPAADGGRWQAFSGGSVHWHPRVGAHVVPGPISRVHAPSTIMGYPIADFRRIRNPRVYEGYLTQRFENGVRYAPECCNLTAYFVYGAIYTRYRELGSEEGPLGWPIAMELGDYGRSQDFDHGEIMWRPHLGAHAVLEPFVSWTGLRYSDRGFPVDDARGAPDSTWQVFEGLTLVRSARDGVVRDSARYYRNCVAVWDTVEAPVRRGQQGYRAGLDPDGDGVGCPTDPRPVR